jgi:protein phosphatase
MGGHAAGEQASAAAIQVFDEVLSAPRIRNALEAAEGGMQDLLAEALQQANNSIRDFGKERLHLAGMGSTAVIGVLGEGIFHVANIGDSRAYLARGEGAQILTKDHSVAAAMCEQGQLTAEEARHHPLRNHLTASLGSTRPVRPHYQATPVLPGDRIVLCSDGLWDMLPDAQIASLALAAPTPQAAVRALLQAANDAGGLDNITVIAVAIPASNEGQEMPWARDAAASSG